jgi:hypothetical protein
MGKHRDLIQLLLIIIIGMFIPFFISIALMFNLDLTASHGWITILSTFGYFLLIFGVELGVVFLYFRLTNMIAEKRAEKKKK